MARTRRQSSWISARRLSDCAPVIFGAANLEGVSWPATLAISFEIELRDFRRRSASSRRALGWLGFSQSAVSGEVSAIA